MADVAGHQGKVVVNGRGGDLEVASGRIVPAISSRARTAPNTFDTAVSYGSTVTAGKIRCSILVRC